MWTMGWLRGGEESVRVSRVGLEEVGAKSATSLAADSWTGARAHLLSLTKSPARTAHWTTSPAMGDSHWRTWRTRLPSSSGWAGTNE